MHRNLGWKCELMQYHSITEDLGLWRVISALVFCFFPPSCLTEHREKWSQRSGDPRLGRTEVMGQVTPFRQFVPV